LKTTARGIDDALVNESAAEEAILLMARCKNPNHCSRETRDEDETTVHHAKHGR